MSPRILADGTDATVTVIWVVFVVLLVALVVVGVAALRRYNANKHTLRSEGLGPLGAAAQRLGQYADRPAHENVPLEVGDEPPSGPDDIEQRLAEITDLHDQGILDDDEYERQRARMLEP